MASKESDHEGKSDKDQARRPTRSSASNAEWEDDRLDEEDNQTDRGLSRLCNPRDDDDEEKTLLRLRTQCVIAKSTLRKLREADDIAKTQLENKLQELHKGRKRTIEKLESLKVKRSVASEMWGWKQCDVVDLTADEELTVDVWKER